MQRFMMKSKLHRATVSDANLHYEGSITIDQDLLEAADILPYEKVAVYNVTNGERFTTYAIVGPRGSGVFCINGAAAHKASKGDIIIVATYAMVEDAQARDWKPTCVLLDGENKIKPEIKHKT